MAKFKDIILKILGAPAAEEPAAAPVQQPAQEQTVQQQPAPAPQPVEQTVEPQPVQEPQPAPAPQPVEQTIEPQPVQEPQPAPAPQPAMPVTNAIETEAQLYKALLKALRPNFEGNSKLGKSVLHVLIDDPRIKMNFGELLTDGTFRNNLAEKIDIEWGVKFARVEVSTERDPERDYVVAIDHVAYYNVSPLATATTPHTKVVKLATIAIAGGPGNGSLLQDVYELNSQEIAKLPGGKCNIGAGRTHMLTPGALHTNHIVVDDSELSPEYEQNKYVSRSHAHIMFSPQYGFLLCADERGTRAAGKRTYVTSNGIKTEMTSPLQQHLLKDGDIITLSKKVNLIFNIVNK